MNKLVRNIIAALLSACMVITAAPALAQSSSQSICETNGTVLGFFNGVNTTIYEADRSIEYLSTLNKPNSLNGQNIRYETFFNISEDLSDFVEVFNQRLQEHDGIIAGHFELFWESLNGAPGWWDLIIGSSPSLQALRESISDTFAARLAQILTNQVGLNPPSTMLTETEHRARIDTAAIEGKKMLFIAHSQGNLFANKAYAYATTKVPKESVKVVHAAPASTHVVGQYVLADQDFVIKMLGVTGQIPRPNADIPLYLWRTAGVNGKRDILGHGFLEIYMHPDLQTGKDMNIAIITALEQLVAPPVQARSGFFTATLTWDGEGDIDLHTTEPNGRHVFYAQHFGSSGYLDMDTIYGYGPEHYYASCDAASLQEGTYRIALANYSGGDGRVATVQIISNVDGVLGTRRITMGPSTGSSPSLNVFDVQVRRDAKAGRLRAFLSS